MWLLQAVRRLLSRSLQICWGLSTPEGSRAFPVHGAESAQHRPAPQLCSLESTGGQKGPCSHTLSGEGGLGEEGRWRGIASSLPQPCLFHLASASNGPGAQWQLSFSILFGFANARKQVPCHNTASPSPGAATVPTGTRTEAIGRWLSHCSARGCAGLLQPQGSAQPACEVHLLPLGVLDEGVVLKEAGHQSQPGMSSVWGCPWPLPAPGHKLHSEQLHIPKPG